MSEGPESTAALTISHEPSVQDVELLHKIVLRAQNEPLATNTESLITAYDAIFKERGLDSHQDGVCFWLLIEMLKPGVQGQTLYTKFENVMRSKGVEVVFDDDMSIQDTASSFRAQGSSDVPHSRQISITSRQSSQDIADHATRAKNLQDYVEDAEDDFIDNPPPHVVQLQLVAVARDTRSLLKASLDQFGDYLRAYDPVAMERTADGILARRLRFKVLTHWREVQRQKQQDYNRADEFYLRPRTSRAFNALFDSARINRMHAIEEERLRGMGLYKLALATREAVLRRKFHAKLKRKSLAILTTVRQTEAVTHDILERSWNQFQYKRNIDILRKSMAVLCQKRGQIRNFNTIAIHKHAVKVEAQAVRFWYVSTGEIIEMQAIAENKQAVFLKRKYSSKLIDITQARKHRRMVLGRWCLARWRDFTQRRKHQRFDELYKMTRKNFKMNLARRCLQKMKDQADSIEHIEHLATEHRHLRANQYAHQVVVWWYNRSHEIARMNNEAVRHADSLTLNHATRSLSNEILRHDQLRAAASQLHELHVQRTALQCLRTTRRKTFEIHRRQQDADALRERHDRQKVRGSLDRWRRRAAESRGEGPLILPPATPAQRRANQLQRIASTTPVVPPRTSFAARLRGEVKLDHETEELEDEDIAEK